MSAEDTININLETTKVTTPISISTELNEQKIKEDVPSGYLSLNSGGSVTVLPPVPKQDVASSAGTSSDSKNSKKKDVETQTVSRKDGKANKQKPDQKSSTKADTNNNGTKASDMAKDSASLVKDNDANKSHDVSTSGEQKNELETTNAKPSDGNEVTKRKTETLGFPRAQEIDFDFGSSLQGQFLNILYKKEVQACGELYKSLDTINENLDNIDARNGDIKKQSNNNIKNESSDIAVENSDIATEEKLARNARTKGEETAANWSFWGQIASVAAGVIILAGAVYLGAGMPALAVIKEEGVKAILAKAGAEVIIGAVMKGGAVAGVVMPMVSKASESYGKVKQASHEYEASKHEKNAKYMQSKVDSWSRESKSLEAENQIEQDRFGSNSRIRNFTVEMMQSLISTSNDARKNIIANIR